MSIAIFLASANRKGNSYKLLRVTTESIEDEGLSYSVFPLYELAFSGCRNCKACYESGECCLKDDMTKIYPVLESSPAILFISPVYFLSFPAKAKALIERAQVYYARRYEAKQALRQRGVGSLIAHCERVCGFDCLVKPLKYFYHLLNISFTSPLFLPGLKKIEDTQLNYCRAFVRSFAQEVRGIINGKN